MEKYWATLRGVARGLPYFTLLTAIVYAAGRDFNSHYWQALGLPLMATDRPVADMLYDGFVGYSLLASLIVKLRVDPVMAIVIFSLVAGAAFRLLALVMGRLERSLARRRALLKPRSAEARRRVSRILDEFFRLGEYVNAVYGPLAGIFLFICFTVLIALVPALAMTQRGTVRGAETYEAKAALVRELRDGLVDVSFVTVRLLADDKVVRAIPIACAGDRCAAMTDDGPISLGKDRFLEESVAKAVWTDACLSAAGLRKRQASLVEEKTRRDDFWPSGHE